MNTKGKAIYKPSGKAGEYSKWACNLYNGCSNNCSYCYNNSGITAGIVGGSNVRLKASLIDEATAYEIFKNELIKYKDLILADEAFLHFNFVSDPCLPETLELNWKCISFALGNDVPVQVLTKRSDWLDNPAIQWVLTHNKELLKVGFSLTGVDSAEPYASPNSERIQAMKELHTMGIKTWASCEPILYPDATLEVVQKSFHVCDSYKIGVLSGHKEYTPQQVRDMMAKINALGPKPIYWKDSLMSFIQKP